MLLAAPEPTERDRLEGTKAKVNGGHGHERTAPAREKLERLHQKTPCGR